MISLPLAVLIAAVLACGYGLGVYDRRHQVAARLDRHRAHRTDPPRVVPIRNPIDREQRGWDQ